MNNFYNKRPKYTKKEIEYKKIAVPRGRNEIKS